jgi:hypothetical protein
MKKYKTPICKVKQTDLTAGLMAGSGNGPGNMEPGGNLSKEMINNESETNYPQSNSVWED